LGIAVDDLGAADARSAQAACSISAEAFRRRVLEDRPAAGSSRLLRLR